MILQGFHIDGYGVWNDFSERSLAPGLNVFVGRNEVGKSTLHAFVRQMLYGFPDGRSKESAHPPLRGGEHGGRLFLLGEDGALTLQRLGRSSKKTQELIAADGTRLPDSVLQGWLRGTDATLFRNVFAFGIEELASLDSLTREEIGARIFDAGLEGAGQSVSTWMAELRKRRELEHRAKGGRLRDLAGEIAAIERELNEARSRAAGHGRFLAAEAEASGRLQEVEAAVARLREEALRWRALLGAWPAELRRRESAAFLADAGAEVAIERSVLQELDGAAEEHRRLVLERADSIREAAGWRAACDAIVVDERLVSAGAAIGRLAAEAELQADRRARLGGLVSLRDEKRRALDSRLGELGSGWSESAALAIDRSVVRRERILGAEERFASLASNERACAAEVARLEGERIRVERERSELLAFGDEPLAVERIDGLRAALAELRGARSEREAAQRRLDGIGTGPRPGVVALSWAVAGAFLVGAALAWIAGAGGAAAVALAAALACAAIAFALGRNGLRGEREAAETLLRSAEVRAKEAAAALGLVAEAGPGDLERKAAWLERQAELRRIRDERVRQAGVLERRIAALDVESVSARGAAAALAEERAGLERSWSTEIADLGGSVRPAGARELLDRAERVAGAAEALRAVDREIASLEGACAGWDAAVAELVRQVGAAPGSTIERLVEALSHAEEGARRRAELDRKIATCTERGRALEEKIEGLRSRGEAVLLAAGVDDRAALEARVERSERVSAARRDLADAERAIAEGLGCGPASDALRERLAAGDRLQWEEGAADAERRLAELESRRLELHEAVVLARREREELESSADVPRLAAQYEALRADFAASLGRWRAAALLERLLEETLERFQRERQPAVIRYAGEAFARVTRGRYRELRQPAGVAGIEAIDGDGRAIESSGLSRGTRDQLYLCLRLGLVRAFAERGTRLPLLMDDVLVNFDPERAAAMAEVLAGFAAEHQVLFFTCHPETVGRLRAASPEVRVVELA